MAETWAEGFLMVVWVAGGCWDVSTGEFEGLWSRADDETRQINDPERFAREQDAEIDMNDLNLI